MRRRVALLAGSGWGVVAGAAAGALLAGCARGDERAGQAPAPGQPEDLKQVATQLQTKTVAMIDAINARNDTTIARAKTELQREADRAEDTIKSQTGTVANQVNAAVQQIRTGVLNNDLTRLERARTLLQQAAAP